MGQDELGLAKLDIERPPGQMPAFSFSGARHARAREFFATRNIVAANPLHACHELSKPTGSTEGSMEYYEGQIVVVSRGSCLFLQKMQRLQEVRAVGVVVVNHAGASQVMTCPLQERGAGRDIHIPAVMVSQDDGKELLELMRAYGERGLTA